MTRRPDLGYGRGMSTRVYFVRHGSTPLTAEDRFAGSTDLELSDEGRSQVSQLAERLQSERIAQIYASPMRRTMETARKHPSRPVWSSPRGSSAHSASSAHAAAASRASP